MFRPGVQKCGRALSLCDQKLVVRRTGLAATQKCIVYDFKHNNIEKPVCLRC